MKRVASAAAALCVLATACAPLPPRQSTIARDLPAAASSPKLVVVISIDQFSADLFDSYRPHFTAGLHRLASGTVFDNAYQGQAATETCPGHSTLLTGSLPARTGIIANTWIDQSVGRPDKLVYCAEDETAPGSSSTSYTVSPVHLRVPTLGDILKRLSPGSQNVAVSGKDRAAVMMSGHDADQRWYWKDDRFVTDLSAAPVPNAVNAINSGVARVIAAGEPALQPPPLCQGKAQPFDLPGGQEVGNGRFARAPGDAAAFHVTPSLDGATLALAAGLVEELGLGRDASPDILSVSLSATDYVGHAYGNGGEEMCLNLLSLDRELGDFLKVLDRDQLDYVVVLTADHGAEDLAERLHAEGQLQAVRADPALAATTVGKTIADEMGLATPALIGGIGGDAYLAGGLSPQQKHAVIQSALSFYRAQPQVENVFTSAELAQMPIPSGDPTKWSLEQRARASFDPSRSGDLVVILKPYVSPIAQPGKGYVATHGSPWDYDRRVPIVFWSPQVASVTRLDPVDTVDIMPTIAAMIGVPVDRATIDGHCISGVGANCPAD